MRAASRGRADAPARLLVAADARARRRVRWSPCCGRSSTTSRSGSSSATASAASRLHRLRRAAGDRRRDRRTTSASTARSGRSARSRTASTPAAACARCHGEHKAAAVRELAAERGYDLDASTAYSDSHTDLPFLEAVGKPVAVNPDRELRRVAGRARLDRSLTVRPRVQPDEARARGSPRSASPSRRDDARSAHFDDAERRGKLGHGFSRIDWLETLPDLDPDAPAGPGVLAAGATSAGTAAARSAT